MFGSFLFRSFLTFIASLGLFVSAGEYICETYICDFALMKLVLIYSVNFQSLNFAMIAGFLLYSFSRDLWALSILSRITVSSTVGITLLISLAKMSLFSSQDFRFWVGEYFQKLGVSIRFFKWWSIWKSIFSVISLFIFNFERLDSPMLIALVSVISSFLTKSMSTSRWFLICSSTESGLFSMLADVE